MRIVLNRDDKQPNATLGTLVIADLFRCSTLEDTDRELELYPERKVPKQTAIPRGTYRIGFRYSPHFGCELPWLLDVPGYEFVLIHWGNSDKDTDGCILVGHGHGDDWISESRKTFAALFDLLKAAHARGEEIEIEVK